uniref:Guanine nucleotide-binding protein subunit gamma n=2 Tax=Paramormyrops kingsleyae TaxID=1676925 RepID=A0A3B3S9A6_9TELE
MVHIFAPSKLPGAKTWTDCGSPMTGLGNAALTCPHVTLQEATMKDAMANNNTASISQARKTVEQLKMEACMDRIKVSKAAADLMAYCDAHIREDPLIVPVPASENPFREKKFFCAIL